MWHKYCYIVLSRDSIHSFFDSNCVYLKWTNMSRLCLNKKLTNATYLCRLTVPPSEEKWLERAQHYFNKKTLLVYAVFTGNNNIFRKSCSVALLFFCNVTLTRVIHSWNMVERSSRKRIALAQCIHWFFRLGEKTQSWNFSW